MRCGVLLALTLLAGCPQKGPAGADAPPPPPPPAAEPDATPPVTSAPPDAAPPVASAPPDAAPPAGKACAADAQHCCMADGRIVELGPCQPVYRQGDPPAVTRDPDGKCRPRQCLVRCLPLDARIASPRGEVAVSALRVGDEVWTLDAQGRRVAAPVERVASLEAPRHTIVVVRLDDGRVLRASAGHPTADGREVGDLVAGDPIDGARVVGVAAEAYDGGRTWDLRPASATGAYWADGVLLGSTL